MIWLASLLLIALAVVLGSLPAWRRWKRWIRKRELLMNHNNLTRRMYACMKCYRQMFPPERRYSCGICEFHDYCSSCFNANPLVDGDTATCDANASISWKPNSSLHQHYLYRDKIDYEKDGTHLTESTCSADLLLQCFHLRWSRYLIGQRPMLFLPSSQFDAPQYAHDYAWISYDAVPQKSAAYRTYYASSSPTPIALKKKIKVGIYLASSAFWYATQYACLLKGYVAVPIHASMDASKLAHLVRISGIDILVTSVYLLDCLVECFEENPIDREMRVVAVDDNPFAYVLRHESSGSLESLARNAVGRYLSKMSTSQKLPALMIWSDIDGRIDFSDNAKVNGPPSLSTQNDKRDIERDMDELLDGTVCGNETMYSADPNEVVMLMSTSGSSGLPKLTVFYDRMLCANIHPGRATTEPMTVLSIEPLRQSFDVLCRGGKIGVYCGSIERVMDDIASLRPTVIGATPSFWNNLYASFVQQQHEFVSRRISTEVECRELEVKFIEEYKNKRPCGNRLRIGLIGGAASSQVVREWLFDVIGCVVVDGYGTTETGGLIANGSTNAGVALQLIDCPEFGYLTSDTPYPRGEIIAKTNRMTTGYYNDDSDGDATSLARTESDWIVIGGEEYFRTGDIGELKEGKIHVIDRKKSLFKLAQGVFVAPEKLETVYIDSLFIAQVFVWGSAGANAVSAVIVPSKIAYEEVGVQRDSNVSLVIRNEVIHDKLVRLLRKDMSNLALKTGLENWEVPQHILLETDGFSVANGLLTTIGKMNRPALQRKYRNELQVGEELRSVHDKSVCQKRTSVLGLSLAVEALLTDVLFIDLNHIQQSTSIMELGLDSLQLARLSNIVRQRFSVSIPIQVLTRMESLVELETAVMGGVGGLACVLRNLQLRSQQEEGGRDDADSEESFLEIEVSTVWQSIASSTCLNKKSKPGCSDDSPGVLLTGATGYLGCFLLHSLLKENVHVYALVRKSKGKSATERLLQSMQKYQLIGHDSSETLKIVTERVTVIEGDLSDKLGLSEEVYECLLNCISVIYHCAGMVNSVLPYSAHKLANVDGTAAMIRFAIAAKQAIVFNYISTVGMLCGQRQEKRVLLDSVRSISPSLGGYGQSKLVSESLVWRMADAYPSIAVRVFRPGTMFASSSSGVCNRRDGVNALISGIHVERMCYDIEKATQTIDGEVTNTLLPHQLNLVSVDAAAEAIVSIAEHFSSSSDSIYHICSRTSLKLTSVIARLQEEHGEAFEIVNEKQFEERVLAIEEESHPWFFYKSIITSRAYSSGICLPDIVNTETALTSLSLDSCLSHFLEPPSADAIMRFLKHYLAHQ